MRLFRHIRCLDCGEPIDRALRYLPFLRTQSPSKAYMHAAMHALDHAGLR
ncbi:hypothetical protein HII36_50835 [Nonomuraea sp. NN258]|nr:hypothetical protein [Nonomuraea antri]NRQ40069.1 hypothetical protein [Nonomuraea antri]